MGLISHYLAQPVTPLLILESAGLVWNAYMLIKYDVFKRTFKAMKEESEHPLVEQIVMLSSVLTIATSSLVVQTISYVAHKIFSSRQPSLMEWNVSRLCGGLAGTALGLVIHFYSIIYGEDEQLSHESKKLLFSTTLLSPFGVHFISHFIFSTPLFPGEIDRLVNHLVAKVVEAYLISLMQEEPKQ